MAINPAHTFAFCTAFTLLSLSSVYAQDKNLHIYLAFGQSNMSGQATVTDADRVPDQRFLVLRAANHSNQKVGEFYPAAPPMGHSASKVGIADIFGRTMVANLPDSIKVAVANIAIRHPAGCGQQPVGCAEFRDHDRRNETGRKGSR